MTVAYRKRARLVLTKGLTCGASTLHVPESASIVHDAESIGAVPFERLQQRIARSASVLTADVRERKKQQMRPVQHYHDRGSFSSLPPMSQTRMRHCAC